MVRFFTTKYGDKKDSRIPNDDGGDDSVGRDNKLQPELPRQLQPEPQLELGVMAAVIGVIAAVIGAITVDIGVIAAVKADGIAVMEQAPDDSMTFILLLS